MSSSDHDNSEGSRSSWTRSPYSSPSQHVPQLANALSGITCEDVSLHGDAGKKMPFLCITEQPQNYFRFRYKSEMVGTHGCLLGKSAMTTKNKTHPTVELVNYTGKAIIRCRLSQADKDDEHPHKLFENEQEDRDVSAAVPEQGSYKVSFAGMGIIHTAKKDVPGLLFKKYEYAEMMKNKNVNVKQLRERSENTAKSINLNIVRLRFSAHDAETDEEVCPPVFSEPIHNMKSAAVNDLKICRMDRHFGRARGGDDVFLLVEKVNKKNIMIRLFEMNDQGEEVWSANGNFLLNDVHHQYAIVFRTPPYRYPDTLRDVKVNIELVRPSDQRTSEPKEFVYKADPILRQNKRRRPNSSYSSMESSSGGSLKSLGELPTTVEMINQDKDQVEGNPNVPVYHIEIPPMPISSTSSNGDLGDALYYTMASQSVTITVPPLAAQVAPMLGKPNVPEPPVIQLNSSELERLINPHIPSEERKRFCEADWSEYMLSFGESLSEKTGGSMDFSLIRQSMQLVADGGRAQGHIKKEPIAPPAQSTTSVHEEKRENIAEKLKGHNEYNAFYSAEDGNEVKKLVKEICDLIKNKRGYNKQTVRAKLERLFEFKLSNGDAFLHMTLCSNQSSFDFIVRLIHSLRMPHLLNKTNKLHQTILHLAVIYDVPSAVQLLVAKGCDPMLGDDEGSNAVHYAVICQTCLEPLLKAIKHNDVAFDLNAYNQDKQTALHLAAIYDSEQSARLLLQYGASYNVTDNAGRTALHLAAYDGYLAVMRALVAVVLPDDIDAVDGCGNTALQIVCGGGVKAHTVEMIKLLLDKKADPTKHLENNEPAWRMCLNKPALWDTVRPYVPENYHDITDDDIKSEPDEDFESADEGLVILEPENLVELPLYIEELSRILDARGAWRSLAERTRSNALLACCQAAPSPARALLACLKETGENLTSQSLVMHLDDMGETIAANVVRRYISDK